MKLRNKLVILLAAILISFVGFNLIASPIAKDWQKAGNSSDYEIVARVVDVKIADCC
jgi:hypothetical protein